MQCGVLSWGSEPSLPYSLGVCNSITLGQLGHRSAYLSHHPEFPTRVEQEPRPQLNGTTHTLPTPLRCMNR